MPYYPPTISDESDWAPQGIDGISQHILSHRNLNAQLPIPSLPDELLCHIFLQYIVSFKVDDDYDYESDDYAPPSSSSNASRDFFDVEDNVQWKGPKTEEGIPFWVWWLILTRVCHRWRIIVLSTAELWSQLDPRVCRRPEVVKKFISRSRSACLDVTMTSRFSEQIPGYLQDSLQEILHESSRIRSLDVECPFSQSTLESGVLDAVNGPFSELRSLTLYGLTEDEPSILPLVLHETPRYLTHIVLCRIHLDWATSFINLPSSVTHLSITLWGDSYLSTKSSGALGDVVAALRKLPKLEQLHLNYALPDPWQEIPSEVFIPSVELHRLEELFLEDTSTSCAFPLFQRLVFPSTCRVKSKVTLALKEHPLPTIFSCAFSKISSSPRRVTRMSINILYTMIIIDGCMDTCQCFTQAIRDTSIQHQSQFVFEFMPCEEVPVPEAWRHLLEAIGPSLFSSLKDLNISPTPELSAAAVRGLLRRATQVEYLTISQEFIPLAEALLDETSDDAAIVPRLKELKILFEPYLYNTDKLSSDLGLLCTALEKRKARGHGLSRFTVFSYTKVVISEHIRTRILATVPDYEEKFLDVMYRAVPMPEQLSGTV